MKRIVYSTVLKQLVELITHTEKRRTDVETEAILLKSVKPAAGLMMFLDYGDSVPLRTKSQCSCQPA
jgi:hypothetical protein